MDASLIYQNLAVIAAFLLVYSLIAGRFESRLVNGPLLFLLMGWLLGPGGIELLSLSIDSDGIKLLAELTLVIVLFSDAANTNWQVLLANRALPIRLLLIGLPLTLAAGALFGHWLFPDLPLLEMAILSTILAPTDAALGKAVVSNPAVPAPSGRDSTRRAASTTASAYLCCSCSSPLSPPPSNTVAPACWLSPSCWRRSASACWWPGG